MPAEGRENPLLKKGNSDAFFREKYLTKNNCTVTLGPDGRWYFSLLFEYPKQEVPKKAAGKGPGGMESHRA